MSEGADCAPNAAAAAVTPDVAAVDADEAFLKAAQACFPDGAVTFMLPPRARPAAPQQQEEQERPEAGPEPQLPRQQSWVARAQELLAASAAARVAAVGDFVQDRRLARIPLVPVALVAGGAAALLQQHLRARFPHTFAAVALPRAPAPEDPRVRAERLLAAVCRALHLRPPGSSSLPQPVGTGLRTLDALAAHVAQLDDPQPVVVCIPHAAPLDPADRALLAELFRLCLLHRARRVPAPSTATGTSPAPWSVRLVRKPVPLVLVLAVPAPTAPERALGVAAADLAHAQCFALADARGAVDRLLMRVLNQWAARAPAAVAPRALLYALEQHALADRAVAALARVLDTAVHEQQRNEWKHAALALDCERLAPADRAAMAVFARLFRCLLLLDDAFTSSSSSSNIDNNSNSNDYNSNISATGESRMAQLLRAFLGYETEFGAPVGAALAHAEACPRERAQLGDPLAAAWLAAESLDVDRALRPALARMRACLRADAPRTAVLDRWAAAIAAASARVRAARPLDTQTLAVLVSHTRHNHHQERQQDQEQEQEEQELVGPFFELFRPLATLTQTQAGEPDILEPGGLVDTLKYATGGTVAQRLAGELLDPTYPCAPGSRAHHVQQQTSLAFRALLALVRQQQRPGTRARADTLAAHRRGTVGLAEWLGAFALSPGADRAAFGAAVQLLSQHAIVLPKMHHPDVVLLNLAV